MRLRRVFRALLLLTLSLVLALGGTGVYLVRRPFPQIRGDLRLAGLTAPVEVVRDRWGIPHIYAQNSHDLFFAQGYVHAQDRLWQMHLFRRTAAGRLSEMFGSATVETDRFLRVIGLRRAAEEAWAGLTPDVLAADPEAAEMVQVVQAYSDGVNAFLAGHRTRLPLEFTLLGVQPEPWTPVDSISFGKVMAWDLGGNWSSEILRAALAVRFGEEGMRELVPTQAPGTPIITIAGQPVFGPGSAAGARGRGSNNWVVAPGRSASGAALLANDIHLDIQMPSIWYENHLVGGPYNVIGVSFAGVPGVIVGHNEQVAWGLTNVNPDVQDLYVERFHPRDPDRYLYRDQWERARVLREEIQVKGRSEPEILTVRITRHGPVINPVVAGLPAFLALRWTAHDPDRILGAVLGLNRAQTWDEFRAALRLWSVPSQNVVYADRAGNIGYVAPGRFPIRPPGVSGLVPAPGWTGTHDWIGFVPADRVPVLFNPERGYIVTANNRVAPPEYPYYLGDDFDPGFRAERIAARLEEKPRLTLDDLAAIQADVTSPLARRFVAAWQDVRIADPNLRRLFAEVQRWDGQVSADSRPALVYEGVLIELTRLIFGESMDRDLLRRYLRQGDAPLLVLLALSGEPDARRWGEGRDRSIEVALRRAVRRLEEDLGRDRERWQWGRVHTARFVHPLGRQRGLGWIFNASAPPIGGDGFTVNLAAYDPTDPFGATVIASYRQLIDTKDWTARTMHTTGQSGLPFHRHYRDFVALWARVEYHPLLFARDQIIQAQEGTLTLRP